MSHRIFRCSILAALGLWAVLQPPGAAFGQSMRDVFLHEGAVIGLDGEGRFLAWDAEGGEPRAGLGSDLSKGRFDRAASNGRRIWGVRAKELVRWSAEAKDWVDPTPFDAKGEELMGLAVVGETPLLIFPSRVESPTEKREFRVPLLEGQLKDLRELSVLAIRATDAMLWIGTGYGEWGGHLVGLDARAGRWVQFYDGLHYVTGIDVGPDGGLIVSWSMSHFDAKTLIRTHKPDATPATSSPELNDHYYQRVAYSRFDRTLYGLDGDLVVTIEGGKPTTVAKLDAPVFEREPRAIGVALGILGLFPVAPGKLVIAPSRAAPLLLREGKLTALRAP